MSDKIGLSNERINDIAMQEACEWRNNLHNNECVEILADDIANCIQQALSEQEPLIRKDQMLKDAGILVNEKIKIQCDCEDPSSCECRNVERLLNSNWFTLDQPWCHSEQAGMSILAGNPDPHTGICVSDTQDIMGDYYDQSTAMALAKHIVNLHNAANQLRKQAEEMGVDGE